jgi:HD-GYP domain-containing protein (c-di-GMP phosphodiesterase class II)
VESYDAMVSGRPYKPAHKTGYSLRDDEEIESAKLLEIDPDTLNVFCEELKKTMDESAKFF